MATKDWESNKQWEEGYRYDNEEKSLHLLIRQQTYSEGYQVEIWKSQPYENISSRKFKDYKKALSFAKSYMRTH